MAAWVYPAMIAAGAVMGGMGGKGRADASRQPTTTKYNNTSQTTPYDFDPSQSGNQGAELIAQLLMGYQGLLGGQTSGTGYSLGPSSRYENALQTGQWG